MLILVMVHLHSSVWRCFRVPNLFAGISAPFYLSGFKRKVLGAVQSVMRSPKRAHEQSTTVVRPEYRQQPGWPESPSCCSRHDTRHTERLERSILLQFEHPAGSYASPHGCSLQLSRVLQTAPCFAALLSSTCFLGALAPPGRTKRGY